MLKELQLPKLADDVLGEIIKLEPDNLQLKADFIRKRFDEDLWGAYTEYMRFEA